MRSIGKWLGRVLTALAALIGLVWLFGPVEPVDRKITFDQSLQADQVAAYFAKAEARFDDIVPHLTIADRRERLDLVLMNRVERGIGPGLPIEARAREVWLMTNRRKRWTKKAKFPLKGA